MKLTAEQSEFIVTMRSRGMSWKAIAATIPGSHHVDAIKSQFRRNGGKARRPTMPVTVPNFRLSQAQFDWLMEMAGKKRQRLSETLRLVVDEARERASQ